MRLATSVPNSPVVGRHVEHRDARARHHLAELLHDDVADLEGTSSVVNSPSVPTISVMKRPASANAHGIGAEGADARRPELGSRAA